MSTTFSRVFKTIKTGLAVVGTLSVGTGYVAIKAIRRPEQDLPAEFVLDMDLEDVELVERPAAFPLLQNIGRVRQQLILKEVVQALKIAGSDSRVKGLTARIGANEHFTGLAQIQELRNAVAGFREDSCGRSPTVAYADAFGAAGAGGTLTYYLASAFDKVYMQPSGLLSISGLASSTPFLRDFFAQWKVRPFFVAREEYKNVANQFTQSDYTKEHREATQALLRGFVGNIVEGVAASRALSKAQVWEALDQAPHTCEEAVLLKLVDGSAYRDEVATQINTEAPKIRVPLAKYISTELRSKTKAQDIRDMFKALIRRSTDESEDNRRLVAGKPAIALVMACGQIIAGKGSSTFMQQAPEIASTVICEQLVKARVNPDVKAVVIRVDSPGGSAVASDTIYREILRVKAAGKPVVVSMGNVAASGGYYISAPATKIVAQPSTVTGSIGVVFGKFNIAKTLQQYGINPCTIVEGRNADAQFPFSDWNSEQLKQINHLVDHIYSGFVQKVALGRGKSEEEVRKVAKGRAWTGQDALQHGLVDALGGLDKAIQLAKAEAHLPLQDGEVDLLDISAPLSPMKQILKTMQMSRSEGVFSIAAQVALAMQAMQQQASHSRLHLFGVPNFEAELTCLANQTGPQLLCTYSAPY